MHIGHDNYLRKQQEKLTFLQITHQKSTACNLFPVMINPTSYRKINKSKNRYSLRRWSFRFLTLLHKIISYCFNSGTVPRAWNNGLIKPIPKGEGKDPRDPLSYRGITLISIPCKIYADILNIRLSKWIEANDILTDEQNGFRSNRSCMEHIYTLYTVIN